MSYLEDAKNQVDFVRPGEQWFFYWKTSAALWETRILQFPQHEVIFIPLYWGFHAEGSTWDFGHIHPERDLFRLVSLLTQHGRNFCWLLPLTPAPFLPNGGVPVTTARTLSLSEEGLHLAALDQESKLNKMFSFFEPKVFQAFSQFLKFFGEFLASHKVKAPIWGAKFFYHQDRSISYLEDYSLAYEQGFSRYLKKNQPQGVELVDPVKEWELKRTYLEEVQNLFQATAEASLAPFWLGQQSIYVLGGSPRDTIERSLEAGKSQLSFFKDIFRHYLHGQCISSSLLSPKEKKDLLPALLEEHFGQREIEIRYQYQSPGGESEQGWRNFGLIDIFHSENGVVLDNGLVSFLDSKYKWLYQVHDKLMFNPDWIDQNQDKVKLFQGRGLNRTTFGQMLKLFLMGQKVILDISGLPPELEKRLQVFLLENNLKTQSVNFQTSVHICELGEGRFIYYEGDRLGASPEKLKFWHHLFHFLHLPHPDMKIDQDVFFLWRIRETTPFELNYLDVRRVNIYNPTSYKKYVTIQTQKNFAFMKMIDPSRATAKSTPQGVEVELLPQGRIALDFGHYEEV